MDVYIRTNFEYNMNITHNELVNCVLCESSLEHKMRQIYKKCSCRKCDLKYVVQKLFATILDDDQDITPKKLLVKLKSNKKANDKKCINERDIKYNFDKKLIPNLSQVIV